MKKIEKPDVGFGGMMQDKVGYCPTSQDNVLMVGQCRVWWYDVGGGRRAGKQGVNSII